MFDRFHLVPEDHHSYRRSLQARMTPDVMAGCATLYDSVNARCFQTSEIFERMRSVSQGMNDAALFNEI